MSEESAQIETQRFIENALEVIGQKGMGIEKQRRHIALYDSNYDKQFVN